MQMLHHVSPRRVDFNLTNFQLDLEALNTNKDTKIVAVGLVDLVLPLKLLLKFLRKEAMEMLFLKN